MKKFFVLASVLCISLPALARTHYLKVRKDQVRYFPVIDGNGHRALAFRTKKGRIGKVIEIDGDYVLGIPGVIDFGSVGEDGLHLGPEILGTGVGIGIGPSGVGVAAEVLGYGFGMGITPFKAYFGPRHTIDCAPLYNADGQGYRDCR